MKKLKDILKKYPYGQKVYQSGRLIGKPLSVYIVSHDVGYDYLIKVSETFPYTPGKDTHFFIHLSKLIKYWRHEKEGVQMKIF